MVKAFKSNQKYNKDADTAEQSVSKYSQTFIEYLMKKGNIIHGILLNAGSNTYIVPKGYTLLILGTSTYAASGISLIEDTTFGAGLSGCICYVNGNGVNSSMTYPIPYLVPSNSSVVIQNSAANNFSFWYGILVESVFLFKN